MRLAIERARDAARGLLHRERVREPPPWPYLHVDPTSYGKINVPYNLGEEPNEIRVGRYCSIAAGVKFLIGGNHRTDWVSTYPFRIMLGLPGAGEDGHPASKGPILVGNDVWIGENAVILSGVTIGDGAAIGTEAIVTRDVRPYAIVAGNPAREVRRRFDDGQVNRLLALRWWEWPPAEIEAIVPLLNGAPVESLFEYADRRSS